MKSFIDFLITYNKSIIQWLFVATMVCATYLIFRFVFAKRSGSIDLDLGESPETSEALLRALQSIKDQPGGITGDASTSAHMAHSAIGAAVSASAASGTSVAGASVSPVAAKVVAGLSGAAALEALSKELDVRLTELEQVKASVASGGAKSGEDIRQYLERIKELEGKLAEYEILEDDIADLSLFKEENAKLKRQLQEMSSGQASAPPGTEAMISASEMAAIAHGNQASATPAEGITETEKDLMNAFAEAVAEEKSIQEEELPPADAGVLDEEIAEEASLVASEQASDEDSFVKPQPKDEAEDENPEVDMGDDILAEFAASIGTSLEEGEGLDTDKMMTEMSSLEGLEHEGSALDEDIDTENLAKEASGLGKSGE